MLRPALDMRVGPDHIPMVVPDICVTLPLCMSYFDPFYPPFGHQFSLFQGSVINFPSFGGPLSLYMSLLSLFPGSVFMKWTRLTLQYKPGDRIGWFLA